MKNLPSKDSTEEMRREFEMIFPVPSGIQWYEGGETGYYLSRGALIVNTSDYNSKWVGWQAAIASKQAELTAAKTKIAELEEQPEDVGFSCSTVNTSLLTKARETIAVLQAERDAALMRIREFDSCIQQVASALGGVCCGGVDVNQSNPHSTTAVLVNAIHTLQAKIAEADKQDYLAWCCYCEEFQQPTTIELCDSDSQGAFKVYKSPPITSQRELELLGVIEQKDKALRHYSYTLEPDDRIIARDALALTPDLSSLKEHDARILQEAISRIEMLRIGKDLRCVVPGDEYYRNALQELFSMASELRTKAKTIDNAVVTSDTPV